MISNEDFIKVWMDNYQDTTYQKLGEIMGISKQSVNNRYKLLTSYGVKLPKLQHGTQSKFTPEYIAELNNIIKENK